MGGIWEILGAVAGVLSFIFAVYEYLNARKAKITEEAKIAVYQERLRSLHYSLTSSLHSVDAIVQTAKVEGASVEMLQNLARVARGQIYAASEHVKKERGYLKGWRYGEMIDSPDGLEVALPASAKNLDESESNIKEKTNK